MLKYAHSALTANLPQTGASASFSFMYSRN